MQTERNIVATKEGEPSKFPRQCQGESVCPNFVVRSRAHIEKYRKILMSDEDSVSRSHENSDKRQATCIVSFSSAPSSVHLIDEILERKTFVGRMATMKFTRISFTIHFSARSETIAISRMLLSSTVIRMVRACRLRIQRMPSLSFQSVHKANERVEITNTQSF